MSNLSNFSNVSNFSSLPNASNFSDVSNVSDVANLSNISDVINNVSNASGLPGVENVSNTSNVPAVVSNASERTVSDVLAPVTDAISPFTDALMKQPGVSDTVHFVLDYLTSLPHNIIVNGDVAALVVAVILFYIIVVLINKLAHYFISVFKNLMILTMIGAAFYTVVDFFLKGLGESPDPLYIVFGVVGIGAGFIAVLIAIYFVIFHTRKGVKARKKIKEEEPTPSVHVPVPIKPPDIKEFLSVQTLKKGKHTLTTMLTYILIAEFGVFSSVTVSAPSIPVGVALLVTFFLGVSVYIFRSYPHPVESMKMLLVASFVGFLLSVILGVYWASIPMEEILSLQYFTSSALVAFLTGIALSLFMAGKELQQADD